MSRVSVLLAVASVSALGLATIFVFNPFIKATMAAVGKVLAGVGA